MAKDDNWLLSARLRSLAAEVPDAGDEAEAVWQRMEVALADAEADEVEEIALPVLDRSLADLEALFAAWDAGRTALPEWDKAVLKRAMKAYRKRLKLMRLDDESSASRNPLSRGDSSSILGVKPPGQYDASIWALLVKQGRLKDGGHGLLELV